MTELNPHQKDAIGRATHLREDIKRFHRTWPALNSPPDQAPPFTWSQLERQLSNLSATPGGAALVQDLVAATRKQAQFKPAEMVLREILCIASAVMDETFPPSDPEGPSSCSEEAPMR
ncbi:hypothetical protein [Caulobacter sp. DWR1-3-2b1]|uniref:hypothetical protein n=1 Tax=Caulobacter sp. DWR1-3-2b1 TaxID=2804670 RepID=UPI003CE6C1D4